MINAVIRFSRRVKNLAQRYFNTGVLRQPNSDILDTSCRPRLPCPSLRLRPPLDVCALRVEKARAEYECLIRTFLRNEYFPREPSVLGLLIPQCIPHFSFYLEYLINHYLKESNGFIAFKVDHERKEKEMIGLLFGKKKYPWEAEFYEKWAERSREPECIHMYFHAHCFRHPGLFKKYKVPFLYDIEMVSTAARYTGQGVGEHLLRAAVFHAREMCYPVVHVIATSSFLINPCKRLGMKKEWTMHYRDYVDYCGRPLFCLRNPHSTVNIFVRTPQNNELYTPEYTQLFKHLDGELDYPVKQLELEPFAPSNSPCCARSPTQKVC